MRLQGKTALITGASSGIGKAIAIRFGAEGAHVIVNFLDRGNNKADAQAVVETITGAGGSALAIAADVTDRGAVEAMVAQLVAIYGRLDILVNNAGIEIKKPFLEITEDEWLKVIAVNLTGVFHVTQAAVRVMAGQEPLPEREARGKIVNISSTHEDISFPGYTAYCASKGGLRMFTRNLCVELSPMKITINNIAPGAIATPINQSVLASKLAVRNTIREIPWGRWGTPEEVASTAVFLVGDESDYLTGSTIYQDGGLAQQVTQY
ncbi:glucose 1-dehydrogenase [Armatimonas sp.]|uniref:SDR family NAD(P)-dependent oxidoreductase n=1 Tax=Armatimonas sp. TaxID=1872638 RepID=UPI00286BFB6A|nr:glucose 1-dehydrogenase [Armatimonas sp.]